MAVMKFRIEAIKPKPVNRAKVFDQVIEKRYQQTAQAIKRDFDAITKTWDHEVKFTIRKTTRSGRRGITVTTNDRIFGYVNNGTEPHIITPVRARALHFQEGYTAKSRPGWIGSQDGGPFGDDVYAQQVNHPGTDARKFDVAIARRRQKELQSKLNQDIAKANRKLAT